jgi:phenylalanyl-tRNA synthetase beta chain
MKLSFDWLRDFVKLPRDLSATKLAHDLTMTTVEVEGVVDLTEALCDIVIGQVLSVSAGSGPARAFCDFGDRGQHEIAAPAGLTADELVAVDLGPAQESFARAKKLGVDALLLGRSAEGLLRLPAGMAKPGNSLSSALDWDDLVLEIDNKSLTNRPDLWGHIGMARELAAIYKCERQSADEPSDLPARSGLVGEVEAEACNRYILIEIESGTFAAAPFWVQSRLARIGQRPVNLYTDLTNYLMFTTGQPCHAFDAERVQLPIGARLGKSDESLHLLNGATCGVARLPVICDARGPIALAGVMGGAESAVTASTRRVLIEIANFDALAVRQSASTAGIRTDASARFEKAVDTQRCDVALAQLQNLLPRVDPSARILGYQEKLLHATERKVVRTTEDYIASRLGMDIPVDDMARTLRSLDFEVRVDGRTMSVTAPSFRSTGDISGPHDLVEEVARIHGYDNFPTRLPVVSLTPQLRHAELTLERRVTELLAVRAGMQQIITYPWVSTGLLEAAGMSDMPLLEIGSPPAPDQRFLRPSLIPSLLQGIITNLKHSDAFGVFEVGAVYLSDKWGSVDDPAERLPRLEQHCAGALVGSTPEELFLRLKGILDDVKVRAQIHSLRAVAPATMPWANSDVCLCLASDDGPVGGLGLLSSRVRRLAGIKRAHIAAF